MRLQNPNYKFPFFNILSANRLTNSNTLQIVLPNIKNKKYHHFYIEIFQNQKSKNNFPFSVENERKSSRGHFDISLSKIGNDSGNSKI